jgi:hypothetical protein
MIFTPSYTLTAMLSLARGRSIHPAIMLLALSTIKGVKGRTLVGLACHGTSFLTPKSMN